MATFWMCYTITINGTEVRGISKVEIVKSVDSLADVAYLEFPAYIQNKVFDIEKKWKRGDEVVIKLGYNNKYTQEFKGYIRAMSVNNPCLISCEDEMYLFRKKVEAKGFKKASVDTILKYVCSQVGGFTLDSSVGGLTYDKFIIRPNSTGYEVIAKIKEQFGIKVYVRNGKLVANLAFVERNGVVTYDFEKNVKAANLDWVVEEDVKVQVVVRGIGKDNKVTKNIEAGEQGGEVVKLPDQLNVTDEGVLKKMADERLKKLRYSGYRGDLTGWGRPYCDIGFTANIKQPYYAARNGGYYVKSITIRFGRDTGFERQVSLGPKLT